MGAFQNVTCYYPAGNKAAYNGVDFVPCNKVSGSSASWCCNPDDICTKMGYCVGSAGVFYRGACTDKSWNADGCPELCRSIRSDNFANFLPCVPGIYQTNNWTCDGGGGNVNPCGTRNFPLSLGALFSPYTEPTVPQSATTVTITGTAPLTTCSARDSEARSSETAAAAAAATPSIDASMVPRGTVVGVGVGLGLACVVVTLASLVGLLREYKRRRAVEKMVAEMASSRWAGPAEGGMDCKAVEAAQGSLHEIGSSN